MVDRVVFALAADGAASWTVTFPGLYVSPWVYPNVIEALVSGLPDTGGVEVRLPRPLPDLCADKDGRVPTLANVKVARPFTLVMPDAGPRERSRAGLCEPPEGRGAAAANPEAPYLTLAGMSFERSARFLIRDRAAVGLALTASKFVNAVEIDRATPDHRQLYPTAPPGKGPRPSQGVPLPRLTINASVLEADAYVGGVELRALSLYFNKTHSVTIGGAKIADELSVNDNDMGPVRFRNLSIPRAFRVDGNRIRDSLYLTEAVLPGETSNVVPSLLHNQIDGNLVVSLRTPGRGPPRRLRVASASVGGSAYVSFADEHRGEAGSPRDEVCGRIEDPLGPARVQIVDSRVASRLVLSVARRAELYRGSGYCVLTPVRRAEPTWCGAARSATVDVELTGTSAGVFAWNLPRCTAAGEVDFTWSGQNFEFKRFEPLPLEGPALVPVADSRADEIGKADEFRRIIDWANKHSGDDHGDVYTRLEAYTLAGGDIFGSWRMKGEKVLAILYSQGAQQIARISDASGNIQKVLIDLWVHAGATRSALGSDHTSESVLISDERATRGEDRSAQSLADDLSLSNVLRLSRQLVLDVGRLLLLAVVYIWGYPAGYGEHPQLAFALLVLSVPFCAFVYWCYSAYCEKRPWPAPAAMEEKPNEERGAPERRSSTDAGDASAADPPRDPPSRHAAGPAAREAAPHEYVAWKRLAGSRYKNGYYSGVPGFLQKDVTAWLPLSFFKFSLDCTIPLIQLEYRREYQVIHDGGWRGRIVTHLPTLQLVLGIWLGTWAVAMFFV